MVMRRTMVKDRKALPFRQEKSLHRISAIPMVDHSWTTTIIALFSQ